MKEGLLILLLLSIFTLCNAQTEGEKIQADSTYRTKLKSAELAYELGLFSWCLNETEKILSAYVLPRAEKVKVLELAAKTCVEIGDIGKADTYINIMLKAFPHYELKEEENPEQYNRLVKKYKVHPQFSIGIRNTADWMNYITRKTFVYNGLEYDAPYEKELQGILNGFGFMYYGWAEYQFDRDISLNADMIFKWTKVNRDLAAAPPFDLHFEEQDNFLEIPLYVKKYFHVGKNVLPYVTAGLGWLYMLKANASASIYYPANDSSAYSGTVSMLPMRNRNTFEWILGAGIGYKYRNLRLFIDARFYGGLNSITNPGKVVDNSSLADEFFYIDNFVILNQFELGASVSYTLFNSVKRGRR